LAKQAKKQGVSVLVLDPSPYKDDWEADFITDNPDEFLDVVFASQRCMVIVDESGDMIGRYGGELNKLATRARHNAHNVYFIMQRAKQIDPTIRANCENIICFSQSLDDTKDLAREFVDERINDAHTLNKGEYIYKVGYDPAQKDKVF
jgi:hypothetical protein